VNIDPYNTVTLTVIDSLLKTISVFENENSVNFNVKHLIETFKRQLIKKNIVVVKIMRFSPMLNFALIN
jgi:hypothetical protein